MRRTAKYLIGGIALTGLMAGGIAASAHRGDWGHSGGGHGGGYGKMGGKGGMMGAVCKGNASEIADLMLVRLEYKIKPTDAQKPAFNDLKAAAKTAALKAKAGCPTEPVRGADGARPAPKAPTERLALMEAKLAAELDAIRTVRPAADKLYATLSDEQKTALVQREGSGWKHRGDGGGRGGRGEGGEPQNVAPQPPVQK
jgi:hypothetical protein